MRRDLDRPIGRDDELFGSSVALDEDSFAVGWSLESNASVVDAPSKTAPGAGAVRVYR